MSSPAGLEQWWTQHSVDEPGVGEIYELCFGPEYDWRGTVTTFEPHKNFELEISHAHADWNGTHVGFYLEDRRGSTIVQFCHLGLPELNQHYRISCHCWAMYLRFLRRYLEF